MFVVRSKECAVTFEPLTTNLNISMTGIEHAGTAESWNIHLLFVKLQVKLCLQSACIIYRLLSITYYHHLSFYHWNQLHLHTVRNSNTHAMPTRHMMYVAVPMPAQASTTDSLGYGARMTFSSWNVIFMSLICDWKEKDHRRIINMINYNKL